MLHVYVCFNGAKIHLTLVLVAVASRCSGYSSCTTCLQNSSCMWCSGQRTCLEERAIIQSGYHGSAPFYYDYLCGCLLPSNMSSSFCPGMPTCICDTTLILAAGLDTWTLELNVTRDLILGRDVVGEPLPPVRIEVVNSTATNGTAVPYPFLLRSPEPVQFVDLVTVFTQNATTTPPAVLVCYCWRERCLSGLMNCSWISPCLVYRAITRSALLTYAHARPHL